MEKTLILIALLCATYYSTSVITGSTLFEPIRNALIKFGRLGTLISCFQCLSLYTGLFWAIFTFGVSIDPLYIFISWGINTSGSYFMHQLVRKEIKEVKEVKSGTIKKTGYTMETYIESIKPDIRFIVDTHSKEDCAGCGRKKVFREIELYLTQCPKTFDIETVKKIVFAIANNMIAQK